MRKLTRARAIAIKLNLNPHPLMNQTPERATQDHPHPQNRRSAAPARRGDGSLRFPYSGIGRKTSGSQNIKGDVQGYSCLPECEIDRDFRTRNDLWKLYFLSLHRDGTSPSP